MIKCSDNSNVWDCFDKIYCISVEERQDRRQEAYKQFESIGLKGKVEFFIVQKHPKDSEQGIFESHILCIRKGLEQNAGTIAVFEDDIVFDRFDPDRLKKSIDYMASLKKWGILFFGCLFSQPKRTDCDAVLKINYRSLTQGYVISGDYAREIATLTWEGISYDGMLRDIQKNYYAVYPSFAFQSNAVTDNDKYVQLDRFRRFMGGLHRIQVMNEFYNLNKTVILAIHALCLAIVIGLMLLL